MSTRLQLGADLSDPLFNVVIEHVGLRDLPVYPTMVEITLEDKHSLYNMTTLEEAYSIMFPSFWTPVAMCLRHLKFE